MNVKLIAHTKLSNEYLEFLISDETFDMLMDNDIEDSKVVALSAIRTCYSPNKPSQIIELEGNKYFNKEATDGKEGSDADRLIRHIINSGHTSTLEHINYTFAIEGVSRSLLAQLTRHRQFSFSVQSQRYVKFGSGDKSGGFDYVVPPSIESKEFSEIQTAKDIYKSYMEMSQGVYDQLRSAGVPAEDARFVLPNAASCNLVMTGNLRAILEFYSKRKKGNGSQWEIADMSERIKEEVVKVDPWVKPFFK